MMSSLDKIVIGAAVIVLIIFLAWRSESEVARADACRGAGGTYVAGQCLAVRELVP